MNRLDRCSAAPPDGAPRRKHWNQRCSQCKRFARLWPGEGRCDRCAGMLPLQYVPGPGERQ